MPVERQVNFLGRIISRKIVAPGYREDLKKITPFQEPNPSKTRLVCVSVLDWDLLELFQGQFTGRGRKLGGGLWELFTEGQRIRLSKGSINLAEVQGDRNPLGKRIQFIWKPTPDDLDLFIEAATGERPIFSKAPL